MQSNITLWQVENLCSWKTKSSHPKVFCKEGVLENFAKFTGKHLCQSLFFNKVAGLGLRPYLKRGSGRSVFLEILRNFQEHFFNRTPLVAASGKL